MVLDRNSGIKGGRQCTFLQGMLGLYVENVINFAERKWNQAVTRSSDLTVCFGKTWEEQGREFFFSLIYQWGVLESGITPSCSSGAAQYKTDTGRNDWVMQAAPPCESISKCEAGCISERANRFNKHFLEKQCWKKAEEASFLSNIC